MMDTTKQSIWIDSLQSAAKMAINADIHQALKIKANPSLALEPN